MCGFAFSGQAPGMVLAFGLPALALALALLPLPGRLGWAVARGSTRPPVGRAMVAEMPMEILRERFARGEINVATFEEGVSHLLRSAHTPTSNTSDGSGERTDTVQQLHGQDQE